MLELIQLCAIKILILSIAIQVYYQIGLNEKEIEYNIFPKYFKKRNLRKGDLFSVCIISSLPIATR